MRRLGSLAASVARSSGVLGRLAHVGSVVRTATYAVAHQRSTVMPSPKIGTISIFCLETTTRWTTRLTRALYSPLLMPSVDLTPLVHVRVDRAARPAHLDGGGEVVVLHGPDGALADREHSGSTYCRQS